MALPVNIHDLINGQVVEWDRIEFKRGWNPEDVIHTICAFANDINNWGGGYIVIGIDTANGQPILPPKGLEVTQLDPIQGRLLELCYQVQPHYFPISQPEFFKGEHIFIIWVPAGDNRPYSAPVALGDRAERAFFVRRGSRTIIAKGVTLMQLKDLTARIPFDDRVNQQAKPDDLSLTLIQAYLQEVKSSLFEESSRIPFLDLCRQMAIVRGPDEYPFPVNIGLLLFHEAPERFFPQARIEIVIHKDDSGRNFIEKVLEGPIHYQLRNTLDYIKTMVIQEKVVKVKDKAEASRFYNYPYRAIEEVIANAVYHKGYDQGNPIEIQIFPDHLEVLSFPGPMPPIDEKMLKGRRIVARQYRNRRIGDFLKELHLTEGRGSGFPLIHRALENNGSPPPDFTTDADKTFFLAIIKSHPDFIGVGITNRDTDTVDLPEGLLDINSLDDVNRLIRYYINSGIHKVSDRVNDRVSDRVNDRVSDRVNDKVGDKVRKIIETSIVAQSREKLLEIIGLKNHPDNYNRYIKPLIEEGWLEMTESDPTSRNQKYRITKSGNILLQLISKPKAF